MGTPLPPNEAVTGCADVFGSGKVFGDLTPPRVIQAIFTGFIPDQAWDPDEEQDLLTPHLLEIQVNPCQYQITVNGIQWFLWFRAASTVFSILDHVTPKEYFLGDVSSPGALTIQNENSTGINVATTGGEVLLFWDQGDL